MSVSELSDQISDVLDSFVSGGSRYQVEKIVTVVVYTIISVASLIWAFGGDGAQNELGAEFEVEKLTEIDGLNLHLINQGDQWDDVRVVLNEKYLWTADTVAAESQTTLQPKDFDYYYYIPRAWGRHRWETLADQPKPPEHASASLEVKYVQIRARQGRTDLSLDRASPPGDRPDSEAPPTSRRGD